MRQNIIFTIFSFCCLTFTLIPPGQPGLYSLAQDSPAAANIKRAEDAALAAMLNSFQLYRSFFDDCDYQLIYPLPRHGQTREAATAYLETGFATELASAIIEAYTWFTPESDCLALRPCDGLPVLTAADLNYLNCHQISEDHIVFSRQYTNCFALDDVYLYQVEMRLVEEQWKVYQLSLEELNQ